MRPEAEIADRAEMLRLWLLQAVEQRNNFASAEPEQDLAILSLLDQLETLIWVLEEPEPVWPRLQQ